jgi:hypothetical protein
VKNKIKHNKKRETEASKTGKIKGEEAKLWPAILIEAGFAITLASSLLIIIALTFSPGIISAIEYLGISTKVANYVLLLNYVGLAASLIGLVVGAINAKYKKKVYAIICMLLAMFTIPASAGGYIVGFLLILVGGIKELL